MNLPQLPLDKANHALYGAAIALVGAIAGKLLGFPQAYCALGLCAIFAVAKEASDAWLNYRSSGDPKIGPHGVELLDALATIGGGALVAAASALSMVRFA